MSTYSFLNSCVIGHTMLCAFGVYIMCTLSLSLYVSLIVIIMEGFECAIALPSQMNRIEKKRQCERIYVFNFFLLTLVLVDCCRMRLHFFYIVVVAN